MLFNEQQIVNIMGQLMNKTASDGVHWEAGGNRYYTSLLPNMVFSLSASPPPSSPPPDLIFRIRVLANENDVLGELEPKVGTGYYHQAKQLYEAIERTISERFYKQILNALNLPGILGEPTSQGSTLPTVVQQQAVFAKIKGRWRVEFPEGAEIATIDDSGNYSVEGFSENPKFILTLIACNDMLNKIEIAKDFLNGKRLQIEVLNVTPSQMIGVAKHDQHKVKYTRS